MSTPPALNIPPSNSTVTVQIIDSTFRVTNVRNSIFMEPSLPGFDHFDACAYSFLVTHRDAHTENVRRVLFDLGVRKDWTNLAPSIVELVKGWGCGVDIKQNVSEILSANGIEPESIEAIIWSHAHWDHVGDPSTFPVNVNLVVGPGIASTIPRYPEDPKGPILSSAFAGRTVKELSFTDSTLVIGEMRALDFFGDGSFYVLDAPGHAIGHLNALARTSSGPDSFIYMAGDSFHHPSQLRPNQYMHLPKSIDLPQFSCPCQASKLTSLHSTFNETNPFLKISVTEDGNSIALDVAAANEVIGKIQKFDANESVLVMAAHDQTLLPVIDLFPKTANEWKQGGWKEKGKWLWAADFVNHG